MEALISVIIPAYNIEQYIERCLDSVRNQTYKNLEIIIINDGSTDQTGEILDRYKLKDSRIYVIHQKNQGVSAARNKGLEVAKGDYIGFVDGDDVIDFTMYETLVKLLEETEADIAHCGYQMVFRNRIDYYYNTKKKKLQDNKEGLKDLLEGKIIEPALYNKLYRKEVIEDTRLDTNIKIMEDFLMNYYLFKKSKKSIFYDIPLYFYMIRNTSATSMNQTIKKNRDSLYVMKKILEDVQEDLKLIVYGRYIYILMDILRNTNVRDYKYKDFQREQKQVLKEESKTSYYKSSIKGKLKYMVIGVLYFPHVFQLIYILYDKLTGTSKKYLAE